MESYLSKITTKVSSSLQSPLPSACKHAPEIPPTYFRQIKRDEKAWNPKVTSYTVEPNPESLKWWLPEVRQNTQPTFFCSGKGIQGTGVVQGARETCPIVARLDKSYASFVSVIYFSPITEKIVLACTSLMLLNRLVRGSTLTETSYRGQAL